MACHVERATRAPPTRGVFPPSPEFRPSQGSRTTMSREWIAGTLTRGLPKTCATPIPLPPLLASLPSLLAPPPRGEGGVGFSPAKCCPLVCSSSLSSPRIPPFHRPPRLPGPQTPLVRTAVFLGAFFCSPPTSWWAEGVFLFRIGILHWEWHNPPGGYLGSTPCIY